MKPIFHHPIGTIQKLGTPRAWLMDAIGLLILLATIALALIIL